MKKGPIGRARVVLRHLPPALPQATLTEQLDSRFNGRYNWLSFCPGKFSQKHRSYSRAYVEFKRPEDVIEFADFFNGHLFVNEKGTQFRTIVEYAPSQRVPKQGSKKDGRDGTISKDPDYLEFLEFIAKPVEYLPSAEIQLERREAERIATAKDAPIVTPLMEYVRHKRAAKTGVRRVPSSGRPTRRVGASKQGFEKRTTSKTMYVPRDSSKAGISKDKTFTLVTKCDYQKLSGKFRTTSTPAHSESGSFRSADNWKKVLLSKGKEKEIPLHNNHSPSSSRPNQRHEVGGRTVRSIIFKETHRNQLSTGAQSEKEIQDMHKRPPRPPTMQLFQKGYNGSLEDNTTGNGPHNIHVEKPEKHTRSGNKPDRSVWTPIRSSNISQASDELLPSSSQSTEVQYSAEGRGEIKTDRSVAYAGDFRPNGSGRNSRSSFDNGYYRLVARRGSSHVRDADGTSIGEGKPLRRGGPFGYSSCGHEKQVWVQRSSSGS